MFCVIPPSEQKEALEDIKSLLTPGGRAYISVRRDIQADTQTTKGFQFHTKLDLPVLIENKRFAIYVMEKC